LLHQNARGKGDLVKGPSARHEEPKEQLPAVEGVITDAGELEPGDRVVYPNQGVCRITGIEKKEIAGQKLELVRMEREEDGAAVLVPKGKVPTIGLRKVASGDQIEGVFHYLAAQYDDPELDWKVRHRDNADRLIAGGVLGVAEVVKGLHSLSRIRPLPAKEREQYDNARHLLVHEVAVSLAVEPALAEDYIDYALMPPPGVTFKLKPPPKPVELPARPRRKVVRTDDEDLGLDDLGLDLGLGEEGERPAAAEAEAVGDEAVAIPGIPSPDDIPLPEAEGEVEPVAAEEGEAEGVEAEPEELEEEEPEAPRKKAAAKRAEPAAAAKPARGKPAAKKPAPKKVARPAAARPKPAPAPKKAEKKKPAAKAPAKKPARGGKKK
jgi:CarD family transcriptional regulator, regulator of rRNA transcription